MRLGELCQRFVGHDTADLTPEAQELFIFGVSDDSRDVRFGFLFCAVPGLSQSGLSFCAQAAARGAQAIAVPKGTTDEDIGLSPYENEKIVILRVSDVRRFYSELCAHFYPGKPETLVAVTGTNGKTSTVSFIRDIWTANSKNSISLGTLGIREKTVVRTNLEAGLTTFDAKTLHLMLGELARTHGVTHLAMEASSHALHQQRLSGLAFDVGAFTNLTQDHLDYHKTMQDYFSAKAILFRERLKSDGVAVINIGDMHGLALAQEMIKLGRRTITYSNSNDLGDLKLQRREAHAKGQTLWFSIFGEEFSADLPLAGLFQADNVLCAIAVALATGITAGAAAQSVNSIEPVPGRLELVAASKKGASVYVDYAHTPDALDNVLRSLRPHVQSGSKLHVVFGCGGDRDPTKRPIMGRIASELADQVWVTDDNPRSEDAEEIRKQVSAGGPKCTNAGTRRDAIELAISTLKDGDVMVVAGKGHEDYQIVPSVDESGRRKTDANGKLVLHKVPFSDQLLIRQICA